MSFLIGILLAAKGIVFVTGFVALGNSHAELAPPQIELAGEDIRVTCRLNNAYNRDLRKLAQSGTPIVVYLFIDVRKNKESAPLASAVAESHLVFDPISSRYQVEVQPGNARATFGSLDSALTFSTAFNGVRVMRTPEVSANAQYVFSIYAVLGKVKIEALKDNEVDLMYFWNYKRPAIATQPMPGSDLLVGAARSSP